VDRAGLVAPARERSSRRPAVRVGLLEAARPQTPGAKEVVRSAAKLVVLPLVRARRRRLAALPIGITGSAGKTTTKNLLAAMLSTLGPVASTPRSLNRSVHLATTIAGADPADPFLVAEVAATKAPGGLLDLVWVLEPRVGVVTGVAHDHFTNADEAALAKVKLVQALPESGLALLNADDPRVVAMARETAARVVFFGTSENADFRAEDVQAVWPSRLAFTLVCAGERRRVETRLVGALWTISVLAALATAISLGVDPDRAVAAAAAVEPEPHHLSVLETEAGVTFIQDEWKGSAHTLGPALEILDRADSGRSVAVLGWLRHFGLTAEEIYSDAVREARRHADLVVLIGPAAEHGLEAAREAPEGTVRCFETVGEAGSFLREALGAGDLVLVKSKNTLHLERVVLAQLGEVTCRRVECNKLIFCEECPLLRA
jgi:UDP-N-acetylmuramoyl-tripeptide--D-alanyl-D-alanine ligase